ncbi:MAG: hypothetical protein FWC56_05075, partial [Phycisphaerae bacterium]|nr:hypothetical protein [Phycisphaerae bacterium]
MKIVAAITADFDRTFLGLPSRLMADLRGETVIRRTIKRVCQAKELAGVHLLVTSDQADIARSAVGDLSENVSVNVET